MFEFRDVAKSFNNKAVLNEFNVCVERGECVALLGPNGAGKTVFLEILLDFLHPEKGEVLRGFDLIRDIGFMPQKDLFPDNLKTHEILQTQQAYFGKKNNEAIDRLLNELELSASRNVFTKQLSGGQKRKLTFIKAIINHPRLLLLDEPTVGMDLEGCIQFWDKINEMKKSGLTTIITLHHFDELNEYCDRFLFLKDGRIEKDLSKSDIDNLEIYEIAGDEALLKEIQQVTGGFVEHNKLTTCYPERLAEWTINREIVVNKRKASLKDFYQVIYKR
ncbi:ABC transporter ATP-binding protein [Paenibacillus sp. MMS20-IR301]|uniref:ABC transporter ATP-binding protein n=1 Tax=Paenibacillus sp. MMS20-IR301 TaxID=2895946 RepID=UPI0028EE728B|nr:ABC transporter ATP-binding protein [Paenibacillus sp. MMS20-IR301]WNS43485.1 ABC transporter ATP-binding protein [Paenibacillus sp. MMS20-IR301]